MTDAGQATGHCLCGAITITLAGGPEEVSACHCNMCRRSGSGPGMAIEGGKEPAIEGREHITTYRSSDWAERAFCAICGSNLYYRLVNEGDHYVFAGLFDDQDRFALTTQLFIEEKPEFYDFANETKNITGEELFAMFAPPDDKG